MPHLGHAGEVAAAELDVLLQGLLREVQHVRAEQGPPGGGEVGLARVQQAVDPGQELLGAVIGVQHHPGPVARGQLVHVPGPRDGAGDGGLHPVVGEALAGHEGGAAAGELQDDWRVHLAGGLHHRVHAVGAHHVHGGEGEALRLGVGEEELEVVLRDDPGGEAASE
jgi:hypothetical protein